MTFKQFSSYLQKLEQTPSRLAMTAILADLFQELDQVEIVNASYLMQGKLVPKYQSLEFNLSVKMMIRTLARLAAVNGSIANGDKTMDLFEETDYGTYEKEVSKEYKKLGDLGLVAELIVAKEKKASVLEINKDDSAGADNLKLLTINQVHQALSKIAQDGGAGSQKRKVNALVNLFKQLDAVSAKFVARIIIGKLRLGFSTMTIIDALSWTKTGGKTESKQIENAYQKKADIGRLAQIYLAAKKQEDRIKALSDFNVEVGIPVLPALCQRLNSAAEIIEKMGEVIAEPKYDGLRVQIHFNKAGFKDSKPIYKTFTRNLDDTTHMFPELAQIADKLDCKNCILDAEAIGIDKKTGKVLSFQETVTRKRKHGVSQKAAEIPIKFFVFDILTLDDKSLIDKELVERKEILEKVVKNDQVLEKVKTLTTADPEELKKFHEEQLKQGLEGAVIKSLSSIYRSGRKGWRWVKIKEQEGTTGKLKDTLDLIVMGYYFGRGKRTSFGIGAFLAGVLGPDQKVLTVAKIGTGLTDEQLGEIKGKCDQHKVDKQPKQYEKIAKNLVPDVWIDPAIVVEIAADEITKSPSHSAKLALRFPRLVKIRADKGWEDATSLEEIKQM